MGLELFKGGMVSPSFSKDLKTLASLGSDDLNKLASWLKSLKTLGQSSDEETEQLEKLFANIDKPATISASISITIFILRKWDKLNLKLTQIVEDFKQIKLDDQEITVLHNYFQNLESIKHKAYIDDIVLRESKLGLPNIKGLNFSWNLRAIFDEPRSGGNYEDFVEYVPIAILTIESRFFNEDENTSTKTILQFTKEDFSRFVSSLKKFEELSGKIKPQ